MTVLNWVLYDCCFFKDLDNIVIEINNDNVVAVDINWDVSYNDNNSFISGKIYQLNHMWNGTDFRNYIIYEPYAEYAQLISNIIFSESVFKPGWCDSSVDCNCYTIFVSFSKFAFNIY